MPTPPTALRINYTAPDSTDVSQSSATVPFGTSQHRLLAVCETRVTAHHPPGHTLRLDSPTWATETTSEHLSFLLPDVETEIDLVLIAETTGTSAQIKVTTKKEASKPEPPRVMSFGV